MNSKTKKELEHCIDPTNDFVFKKLLGSKGHENRTVSFINCMLNLDVPIEKVVLLNPFTEKDFENDKLSIVDVKAEDENGKIYQIEMQITSPSFLTNRMMHNWSGLYHRQINSGEEFEDLQPVISIWLLTTAMFKTTEQYHHHFQAWDFKNQLKLSDHMSIHVFELSKWHKPSRLHITDFWLYFIKEGHHFMSLPDELALIPELVQAMNVLKDISDSQEDYYRYQARQEFLMVQRSERSEKLRLERKLAEAEKKAAIATDETAKAKDEIAKAKDETAKAKDEIAKAEEKIKALAAKLKAAGIESPE